MTRVSTALLGALVTSAVLAVGLADAEQSGQDGVVAHFNGRIVPHQLPRHRRAAVAMTLSGQIESSVGSSLPRLARLELAFAGRGSLDVRGLPRCPRDRLRNATTAQALARCRSALVGRGVITAEVPLASERPFVVRTRALAFNGHSRGRPAVWVQAASRTPPVSFVLPFYVRRRPGDRFGLLLRAPVARTLGLWPRLRSFRLTLARRYRAGGTVHTYLGARCALPTRLHHLAVPVARVTYSFAPGPTVLITTIRACRVRE